MASLEEKIDEWRLLKQSKKALDKRIKELRSDILVYGDSVEGYGVQMQRRDLTSYDRDRVWAIMDHKGIPARDFTYPELDETKIECLYIEGVLSDDDLRYMRAPKYSYALVEKTVADVQG